MSRFVLIFIESHLDELHGGVLRLELAAALLHLIFHPGRQAQGSVSRLVHLTLLFYSQSMLREQETAAFIKELFSMYP